MTAETHRREESAYDLYARGRSLLSGGHPHQAVMLLSRARREFAKAVQLNPSDDYAHFALALACERTGQRSRARGHAKLAVVLRPEIPDYVKALERLSA